MDEERLFKIAKYIFIIGAVSAGFMLLNTYLHSAFGSKVPTASEFMQQSDKALK